LLTIPNIPAFPSGNFTALPSGVGYQLMLCIACGTTYQAPSTGSWLSGNYLGAAGMTNGLAAGNNLYFAFVQHEPGSQCTTLIDKPFNQNYDECLRYYQKSAPYGSAPGSVTNSFAKAYSLGTFSASTFSLYANHPFVKPLAKTPTVTVWNGNTGTINQVQLWYASSGTVPNTSFNQGVTGVNATDKEITSINCTSGTSTSLATGLFEWAADTGW